MDIRKDVLAAIGNTPLIRLSAHPRQRAARILGKAEFMNPGQSVKDRAALFIIKDAIARGTLEAGRRRSSKARQATPASALRSSAMRSDFAPSSSSPTRRAKKRKTRCACWAPS